MSDLYSVSPAELMGRLKEVRQKRVDYPDGHPTLRYCLKCDEAVLCVEEGTMEYRRLDCRHDHYEHIIEDAHDNAEISAWIDCLEYMEVAHVAQ